MTDVAAAPHRTLAVVIACDRRAPATDELADVLAQPSVAEVLVVIDGPADAVGPAASTSPTAADDRVRVLRQPVRLGQGAAIQRGIMAATADHVLIHDPTAQGVLDPASYVALLAPLADGADVVLGSLGGRRGVAVMRRSVAQSLHLEQDGAGIGHEIAAKVAAGGWDVHETSMTETGVRSTRDGRGIGPVDAVRRAYLRLRLSSVGERIARSTAARRRTEEIADGELHAGLSHLAEADRYANYLVDLVMPWVGRRVHEVGAGNGTISTRLATRGLAGVASEPDPDLFGQLEVELARHARFDAVQLDLDTALPAVDADTVVVCNVLEHIADDVGALRSIRASLPPRGRVILLVPAHEALYSEFDRQVGHYRRYRRADIVNRLSEAGFDLRVARYFNAPGVPLWFAYARLLGRTPTAKGPSSTFDRFVTPLAARIDRAVELPFGQSLLVVGEVPD